MTTEPVPQYHGKENGDLLGERVGPGLFEVEVEAVVPLISRVIFLFFHPGTNYVFSHSLAGLL